MKKKHIIILHTDQQRFDSLGCNGNPSARTPHLDALAREGTNFTRHIVTNPVCMPSRASLLTGLYVEGHRVCDNGSTLWRRTTGISDTEGYVPTIADRLSDAGYYTSLLGKLHLQPHHADEKYGFIDSYKNWLNPEMEHWTGPLYGFQNVKLILGHGEEPYGYYRGHYGRWLLKNHPDLLKKVAEREGPVLNGRDDIYLSSLPSDLHHSMWLAEEACLEIDAAVNREDPMFLFVGFPDPHHPFTPPEDASVDFLDMECPEFTLKDNRILHKPEAVKRSIERTHTNPTDIENAYKHTMASVSLIDRAVGRIVKSLKEKNLYDDTIIIFTSDHGDFLGDMEMLTKDKIPFMNLLNVPFILKPAKPYNLPEIIDRPMSNADVLPTLFKMVDLEIPQDVQGIDIFSDQGNTNLPLCTSYGNDRTEKNLSVIDERYRYTYYPITGEEELYDHQMDPGELENLAYNPKDSVKLLMDKKRMEVLERHARYETGIYQKYSLW